MIALTDSKRSSKIIGFVFVIIPMIVGVIVVPILAIFAFLTTG